MKRSFAMAKLNQIKLKFFPEREFAAGHVGFKMYGETTEFSILGEAWHAMVKAGIDALRRERSNVRHWQSVGSNYANFPIIYNYRHVVELYLKGILIAAEPALILNGEDGIRPEVFKSHRFGKLCPELERSFAALRIPYDFKIDGLRTLKDFRALLADLDHLEIRYPIDVARNPATGDRWAEFNLFEFADRLDAVLEVLKGYASWVEYEVDARCEMAHEARQEAYANGDFEYDPPDCDPPDYDPGDW